MDIERNTFELLLGIILLTISTIHFTVHHKKGSSICLSDVAFWMIGITFGVAPIIMIIFNQPFYDFDESVIFMAYTGVLLFMFGLVLSKQIWFKKFIKKNPNKNKIIFDGLRQISERHIKQSYISTIVIRFIMAFIYGIFISGTATAERVASLPYYIFVLRSLLDLTLFGILLWSFAKILKNKKFTVLPSIIIIIETAYLFLRGRRLLLFSLFMFLFVYLALGNKLNKKIVFFTFIIFIFFVSTAFPFFLSFRNFFLGGGQLAGGLFESFTYSIETAYRTGIDKYSYQENIATRLYIMGWSMDIINKTGLYSGLYGIALLSNIIWAIPSFIMPLKGSLVNPEALINFTFALNPVDSPSNWIAYAFADFGLVGSFFYGFIFGSLLSAADFITFKVSRLYPLLAFIIFGSFLYLSFMIEEMPASTFTIIRDCTILFVITKLIAGKVKK